MRVRGFKGSIEPLASIRLILFAISYQDLVVHVLKPCIFFFKSNSCLWTVINPFTFKKRLNNKNLYSRIVLFPSGRFIKLSNTASFLMPAVGVLRVIYVPICAFSLSSVFNLCNLNLLIGFGLS